MAEISEADRLLIEEIRAGNTDRWSDLIARYEGRLLAFVDSRLGNRASSEDVVQEAFMGFLNSLPNFDGKRPLETYLFSICAYKLTDHLRREGRRPSVPLSAGGDSGGEWEISARARGASSIARGGERQELEEKSLVDALNEQINHWRGRGDWMKIQTVELLFVRGWSNKNTALELGITEQNVANYKFEFLSRLRTLIRRQGLTEDVFPEIYED